MRNLQNIGVNIAFTEIGKMGIVVTEVAPVTLFGQEVPCFRGKAMVKSGNTVAAIIEPNGKGTFKTVTGYRLASDQRAKINRMLKAAV